jgi:endonuclease VIII
MPEGDTIYRSARTLHKVLAGHLVTRFETAYAHIDRVNVDTPIAGQTVEQCEARGKHILMFFSGGQILRTHMRMNGSWHVYRPGERWWRGPHAMRIRVETADWVAVAFDVPVAEFVTLKQLETSDPVAQLGPDLLGAAFDRDEAVRRIIASGHRAIAMTLLDQRIVAGIGNIYKSEVLFLSGVHPETPSSAVPLATLESMMDLSRSLLRDNVIEGSSPSIQTYRNLRQLSSASHHDDNVWVYGRRHKPCRKCGTPIEMKKMGLDARSTYWCPGCQPISRQSTVGS